MPLHEPVDVDAAWLVMSTGFADWLDLWAWRKQCENYRYQKGLSEIYELFFYSFHHFIAAVPHKMMPSLDDALTAQNHSKGQGQCVLQCVFVLQYFPLDNGVRFQSSRS